MVEQTCNKNAIKSLLSPIRGHVFGEAVKKHLSWGFKATNDKFFSLDVVIFFVHILGQ